MGAQKAPPPCRPHHCRRRPPAAAIHPTHRSQENTAPRPSALDSRKRKDISPAGKSGPLAKRAIVASTAAAPSGRAPAVPVPAEDNIWEAVAEETGWTLTDCLAHKVAFAKRADAKSKVRGGRGWGPGRRMSVCAADASAAHAVAEALLSSCIFLNTAAHSPAHPQVEALAQHVKRLRAAGWHLYDARERAAMDGEAMAASLAREEAARKEVSTGRWSQLLC